MFTVPINDRYFEDYVVGVVHEFGSIEVTEAEIIDFAKRYDPQPFHIDPAAAQNSIFGGVIASGWHTASMMMRLLVDRYISTVASLGSPGIDELRWIKPVRPGDALSVRVTVIESKRSRSKPDRGIFQSFIEVLNQEKEVVMSLKAISFMLCRDAPQ